MEKVRRVRQAYSTTTGRFVTQKELTGELVVYWCNKTYVGWKTGNKTTQPERKDTVEILRYRYRSIFRLLYASSSRSLLPIWGQLNNATFASYTPAFILQDPYGRDLLRHKMQT